MALHRQSNKLPQPEECEDTLQSLCVAVSRLDPQPGKSTLHAQEEFVNTHSDLILSL
jgi:hypothetical protein